MKNITQVENLANKKVLLRLDLNVPIENGVIQNDFRIKKILPTIDFLKEQGAKIIILAHIGREKTETLKPVFDYLKNIYPDLTFVKNFLETRSPQSGFMMLENLRQNDGEVNNDEEFAKQLASLGDIYVNEAFSNSHREHASIVGIPKFLPFYSGILLEEEIKNLSYSFNPDKPSLFILGGNKLKTKLPLIKKTINVFDVVFVGGALANDFFKEQGLNTGQSLVSQENFGLKELSQNPKIFLPLDVVTQKNKQKKPNEILDDDKILDAGSESIKQLEEIIKNSNFVLMNGPLGDYPKGFEKSTKEIIEAMVETDAKTIIGGGDTTLFTRGFEDKITFISTGGGAMVKFMLDETLPGIEVLK